ncbi:Fah, partial [Symbiodinium sp. KB8]
MADAEQHIFGLVLMNDWSARDIQKWEYVPLGPFTAKNVATTISPWVVTLDALEAFRAPTSAGSQTDPEPLPYLRDPTYSSYDVKLTVAIKPADSKEPDGYVVSRSNYTHMYWNVKQQLVHHTVTGCNMQPGDCYGSGTISGTTPDSFGSMLELSWKGSKPVQLTEGVERKFLADGDEVIIKGHCEKDGLRVGFGECRGVVLPAHTQASVGGVMKGDTCRERLGGGSALWECAGMARWAVLASVALALSLPVLGNSASHYEVLGLTPSATTEDVRRAYKKLARKYHPDK